MSTHKDLRVTVEVDEAHVVMSLSNKAAG